MMTEGNLLGQMRYIRLTLSASQLVDQMDEELAELYQAMCKWRRVKLHVPGTRVDETTARQMLTEELADVLLIAELLGYGNIDVEPPDVLCMSTAVGFTAFLIAAKWGPHIGDPEASAEEVARMLVYIQKWIERQGVTLEAVQAIEIQKAERWATRLSEDATAAAVGEYA